MRSNNVKRCQTMSNEVENGEAPYSIFRARRSFGTIIKDSDTPSQGSADLKKPVSGVQGRSPGRFLLGKCFGAWLSRPRPPKFEDGFTFWSSREQSSTTVLHSGAPGSRVRRQFHVLELPGAELDDSFTFWSSRELSSATVSHSGAPKGGK